MIYAKKDFPYHKVFINKYTEQSYVSYLYHDKQKYIMNKSIFLPPVISVTLDFIIRCNNAIGNRKPLQENMKELRNLFNSKLKQDVGAIYSKETLEWYYKKIDHDLDNEVYKEVTSLLEGVYSWKDKFESDYEGFKNFIYNAIQDITNKKYDWIVGENIVYNRSLRDNALKRYFCITTGDKGYEKFIKAYKQMVYVSLSDIDLLVEQISNMYISIADVYSAIISKDLDGAKELLNDYLEDNEDMKECKDIYALRVYYELKNIYARMDVSTLTDIEKDLKEIIVNENKKYSKYFVLFEKIMIDNANLKVEEYFELD